jgi:GTP cyclohydrolase I
LEGEVIRAEALKPFIGKALRFLDPEPRRNGLEETPRRWATMMAQLTSGHEFKLTTFPNEGYNEMVVQSNISFFSLCEHHLAPFFGTAVVGYIPGKRIVGISKLARTVECFARRLQVQERMTQQIANFLADGLDPLGVGVVIKARHLCQEMRGIRKMGAETITSCLKGQMFNEPTARHEFLRLAGIS